MDRDQILRLLGEREAAGRAEVVRLEQEAARITGLIEECRREVDRLAIAREVLSELVAGPAEAVPAGRDLRPDAVFADQLLAVLAGAGRPVRC
jgi:outer membrane protein TolC